MFEVVSWILSHSKLLKCPQQLPLNEEWFKKENFGLSGLAAKSNDEAEQLLHGKRVPVEGNNRVYC